MDTSHFPLEKFLKTIEKVKQGAAVADLKIREYRFG